jgi:CDP-diacylglycerol--glycerol-3-phosphate 3-phosphatidyltransferase
MEDRKGRTSGVFTIANALTLARLVLLPVVIAGVAADRGALAASAMALVVLTDLLDGRIARRLGQASDFGKTLDSTVDFVLIYSLFIAFYAAGRITTVQFGVLYLAMLTILGLQLLSGGSMGGEVVARTRLAKPTGALQYLYLLVLVAGEVGRQSQALAVVSTIVFYVLAAAIVLNTVECVVRLRQVAA